MDGPPEFGFHPVTLNVAGQTDTMLAGVPWSLRQFHSHAYEAKGVPPGASVLASSARCKIQILRAGLRTYGFQFHPEYDREMILASASDGSGLCGEAGMTADALAKDCDEHYERFALVGNRLAVNLATFAFPFAELTAV
jgi:GMP synthase-like glutamine amidotransferase